MKQIVKNTLYSVAGVALIGLNSVSALNVKSQSAASWITTGGTNMVTTIENIVAFLIGLLYLIAVIFALYGGFQILTAGGDEDKVKKGKTTLINAAIGLAVIFLASTLIDWIISLFNGAGIVA